MIIKIFACLVVRLTLVNSINESQVKQVLGVMATELKNCTIPPSLHVMVEKDFYFFLETGDSPAAYTHMGCALSCALYRNKLIDKKGNIQKDAVSKWVQKHQLDSEVGTALFEMYSRCLPLLPPNLDTCALAGLQLGCIRAELKRQDLLPTFSTSTTSPTSTTSITEVCCYAQSIEE